MEFFLSFKMGAVHLSMLHPLEDGDLESSLANTKSKPELKEASALIESKASMQRAVVGLQRPNGSQIEHAIVANTATNPR